MRIKNFTLMLMAVLFSTVGFAQKSFSVRNDVAFNRQATVKTLVKQNSIGSAFNVNQQNTTTSSSRASKARAKAPEVVTPPEKGDVEYYTLTGKATYYTSSGSKTENVSRQVKVVWDEEDEDVVYIQGLSYYADKAFVKGTFNKEGDKVIFESGQYLGNDLGVDLYFVAYNGKEIVDAVAEFDEKKSTFTFSDILLDNGDPKELGYYAYFAAGVTIVPLEGEPEIPVEIPKDLEIETYAYSAYNYFGANNNHQEAVSGNLNVGIYGDDVYLQGMSTDAPNAWIKGTFTNDTTVVFASGQLLEEGLYFVSSDLDKIVDEYILIYDPKTGVFIEGDYYPMISGLKDDFYLYQFYYGYEIKPITEKAATPAKSVISNIAFMPTGDVLEFNLAKVDVDGEGLVAEKLFYTLYYQDEFGTAAPVTLSKDDYASLKEDLTEIPATLTDGTYIKDGALTLLMSDHTSWVSIGISAIYYGGDERNESETVWYTPTWPITVTLPDGLTVTEHTFKGEVISSGSDAAVEIDKTVGLAFDGNDMYIRGIGDANDDTWIKGTKNAEGAYVFLNGQDLGNYGTYYRLFFVGFDADGNVSDVTVKVNSADGVYEFVDEFRENASYTDRSYYLNRILAGATISIDAAVEEIPELVEVPEGLKTEAWSFSAEDYFDDNAPVSRSVNIGFDGDDVYVQGLSKVLPSAWVKGVVEDGQITFPYGQYLGTYNGYNVWFLGWNNSNRNVFDYVMEYDTENGVMTNPSQEECIGINTIKSRISASLYESYCNVKIGKVIEKEATPSTPSVEHMKFSFYGDIAEFSIPTVDVDGDGLVADKLFYKLYYDEGDGEAKEVTFVADPEIYKYLTEDMTVIPYGFLDGKDEEGNIFAYDFSQSSVYLNMEHDTWTRIGIQSIYTGGGETNASEIGWYTIIWPQVIELPEGAEVAAYLFTGKETRGTEISKPVNVAKVGDDVYIQGVGSRDDKTWIKGTKNAETGVYTFPKGQYLGLYVNSDQTDYSYLYLMGYSDMLGAMDVKMTYDEENDIFTTTTELIENADYVDKLFYLNRINVGAEIKPIPDVAATPATPSIAHINFSVYGPIAEFTIPTEDVDSNPIITSKLSYKLYYDEGDGEAKEVVFTTDKYDYLTEDMTVIPYGFLDAADGEGNPVGYDFFANQVYLNMDVNTWVRVGIQTIYTGGGETNASEIGWYTPTWPENIELPEGAEVTTYGFLGTYYSYYNGNTDFTKVVSVAKVGDDVYVQGIGTRSSETWIKGTKGENNVYTFKPGQYLGLYVNSAQTAYSYLFLLGYDDTVGVGDLQMTYDEETGIFTTTTNLIENADYTDRLRYLSYVLAGAQLIPGDNPDALSTVTAEEEKDEVIYNIAGQRVGKNYKGIVVKNNKKVLVK